MPPAESGPALTEQQKKILRQWIEQGGAYEAHWAFERPRVPAIPMVEDKAWCRSPIDAFVLEKINEHGLHASPPAAPEAWLRRVYLDLIGLPPSNQERIDFLNDATEVAYERVVDDLLSRPEFGERWGRTWLDLARYADTNGYEKDRPRSIWPYRDWVLQSINRDLPFDEFSICQLAGDMLPNSDESTRIATGFHRNTMLNEEGGIDPLEFRFYAMNDRIATTGMVWMGLTIGCAQCHSHKFDPISHRDYYEFMALMNNSDEPDMEIDHAGSREDRAKVLAKIDALEQALPEKFPLPSKETAEESSESKGEKASNGSKESHLTAFQTALNAWYEEARKVHVQWSSMVPITWTTNLPKLELMPDRSMFSTGDITKRDWFELHYAAESFGPNPLTALRLEVLPDPRLPAGGPGRCYYEGRRGDFFLSEVIVHHGEDKVAIRSASHSYGKNGLGSGSADAKNVLDGEGSTGWSTAQREGEPHQLLLVLEKPLKIQRELKIEMIFERHYAASLGRFRWSSTDAQQDPTPKDFPAEVENLFAKGRSLLQPDELATLRTLFARTTPMLKEHRKEIDALRKKLTRPPSTMVMEERPKDNPRKTFRHHRGEYLQPREEVTGNLPSLFRSGTKQPPSNRLELAKWLVSQENPLVGRVTVDRVWRTFFGEGLVRSQGDFGLQSLPPSHPMLLDWLAIHWMDTGWSIKKLCREIVLSSTYRQSSDWTTELRNKDPETIWLARFPRQRLEAEAIRDSMLSNSGLLYRRLGGPSVRPPQLEVVTGLAYGKESWTVSEGGDRFRRSLYTYSKRTAPFAAYSVFDAPSGETCAVRRERSNTPLQALTLLNDAMFVECAEALASRVCEESLDPNQRAIAIAIACWSRAPTVHEVESILAFVTAQSKRMANEKWKPELVSLDKGRIQSLIDRDPSVMAWIVAARAIMNTDEAITKP